MVSSRPPTSKSSMSFNIPYVTVPKAPFTIDTIVTFMFHIFFRFSCHVKVHILLFTLFQFISVVSRDSKVDNFTSSLFLLIIVKSGSLAEMRLSVCRPMSHRSLCLSFSRAGAGFCIYHLFIWSNLNFLHISQWIILPTYSCLILYSSLLIWCIRLL